MDLGKSFAGAVTKQILSHLELQKRPVPSVIHPSEFANASNASRCRKHLNRLVSEIFILPE